MTAAELLILARAYSEETGLSLNTIGERACASQTGKRGGNNKLFVRLAEGHGCNSVSIERAASWFLENWPIGVAWPKEVAGPIRRKCAA